MTSVLNGSIFQNSSNSNVTAYSSNLLHRSGNYITLLIQQFFPIIDNIIIVSIIYAIHKVKEHLYINLILVMVWLELLLLDIYIEEKDYKKLNLN